MTFDPRARLRSGNAPGKVGNIESASFDALNRGLSAAVVAADRLMAEKEAADRLSDQLTLAKAVSELQTGLAKRAMDLDPLSPNYEDEIRRAGEELRANVDFVNKEFAERYSIAASAAVEDAVLAAAKTRKAALYKQADVVWKEHENRLLNEIVANPAAAEAIIARHKTVTDTLAAGLEPSKRSAKLAALQDGAVLAVAEGLARSGKYLEALRFIRSDAASGVDPDVLVGAERRIVEIESRNRAEWLRATAAKVEDLEYRLYTGEATHTDIATAVAQGLYNGREGTLTQHRLIAERVRAAAAEQEIKQRDKAERMLAGAPEGYPKDRKEADALFEYLHGSEDPETALASAIMFSTKTGFLPSRYRDRIMAAEAANDPEYVAAMASLDDRIRASNPTVDTGAGDRLIIVQELAAIYGGDYVKAARDLADRGIGGKTVNQINTRANDAFKRASISWSKKAQEAFGVDDPRLVDALERRARRLFIMTDDVDQAVRAAIRSLQREGWAVSAIGGGKTVQKAAPETLLPPLSRLLTPEQRAAVIDADIQQLLAAHNIVLPDKLPEWIPPDTPKYRVAEDQRLEVLNDYGFYEPVRTTDGAIVRWRPPNDAEFRQSPIVSELLSRSLDTVRVVAPRSVDGVEPAWRRNVLALRLAEQFDPDGDGIVTLSNDDANNLALIDELEEAGFRVEIK